MNVNHLTKIDKKRARYIKSLLVLHEIEQQDIALENDASEALVSYVVRGQRKGLARNGKKIAGIKKSIAAKLNKPVEELFPTKRSRESVCDYTRKRGVCNVKNKEAN